MANLFDLIAEEEAKALAETRRQIAAEKAAWDALTQEERDAHTKAVEDKYANFAQEPEEDKCEDCGEDWDDCECDTLDKD